MEERTDNITIVRQDNRPIYIRAIRSLALIALLALMVFSLWTFREDINTASAKKLLAYIRSSSYSDVSFERYDVDGGFKIRYDTLNLGLSVIQSDFYYYVAGNNRTEFSVQLKYSDPKITTGKGEALIYDTDGTEFCIVTGYAVTAKGAADGKILSASLNDSGHYSVVCNPAGYRSTLTVYSKKNKERLKWETSTDYIMLSAVSEKCDHAAAVCFGSYGGETVLKLVCLNVTGGEQDFSKRLECGAVYSLRFTEDGSLNVVTDKGIEIYDVKGKQTAFTSFDGRTPSFVKHSGSETMIVFKEKEAGVRKLTVYNDKGETVFGLAVSGDVTACCFDAETIVCISDLTVTVANRKGERSEFPADGAFDVLLSTDGQPILVYQDRIERVVTADE